MQIKFFSKKGLFFLIAFAIIVFIASKINFSTIIGAENQSFTFFQFFGPIAGGFLGPVFGALSVLIAQASEFFLSGKAIEPINLLRLTPMLFGAFYFGKYLQKKSLKDASLLVPLACMALFWLNPVGQQVWFYALYWLIPVFAKLFSKRLIARSFGATFTAHAIGSTIWLYTVPMPAEAWIALIPIVAIERTAFALGISISYVGFNTFLSKVDSAFSTGLHIDKAYVFGKKMFRLNA
ncbi:MAG: hypothetical protein PHD95_01065 [Candidatus ainarchaeum sp.]|nr:hypothetical protein [Candidatus ainarchaeum sp.]